MSDFDNDFFNDLMDMDGGDNMPNDRTQYFRAAFGMPGAKYRSLVHLLPELPVTKNSIWADHCGGTGVVSWNVPECKTMMFNDRYSGVVAFYRALKFKKPQLIEAIKGFVPHSREEWINAKMTWVSEVDDVERAAKWYYMTKLSVINKRQAFGRGITTVFRPMADTRDMEIIFESLHQKLKLFNLENLDIRVSFKDYDHPNTVHYIDPPYLATDQGTYEHKWHEKDMLELFRLIEQSKGFVALSHYPCELIDSQSFWTRKVSWDVHVTSEPQIGKEENNKAGLENFMAVEQAKECLWIKEAV